MIEKIKNIIAQQLRTDAYDIDDDADIFDDLGADSLDVVEMLMAFETAFGISVPDDDLTDIRTVNDIKNYIELNSEADREYTDEDEEEDDAEIEDFL